MNLPRPWPGLSENMGHGHRETDLEARIGVAGAAHIGVPRPATAMRLSPMILFDKLGTGAAARNGRAPTDGSGGPMRKRLGGQPLEATRCSTR